MGSMITLGVEKFEIDWGKNSNFADHSCLFQPSDIDIIPYYYADNVVEMKEGFSRKLGSIKKRLDLLGYSSHSLARIYEEHLDMVADYYPEVSISFEQFRSIISSIDLGRAALGHEGDYDPNYIFRDPVVRRYLPANTNIDTLDSFFGYFDPYITLKLLAENEKNANYLVQWRYADVVENGWVSRDQVVTPLPDASKILVVTEGSSDSFIIERALAVLRPDIADFFHFVDMKEHYPFTGTGELFKFCQGLSRIKIQNNVLIIFDNDAAGINKFDKCCNLNRPKNMHICKLPDHEYFTNFKTIGPNGESMENINGSAVSIECFLDLSKTNQAESRVRWTSFDRKLQRYQGEIENKNSLVKAFKTATLTDGCYDTTRLQFLIDYLVDEWVANTA